MSMPLRFSPPSGSTTSSLTSSVDLLFATPPSDPVEFLGLLDKAQAIISGGLRELQVLRERLVQDLSSEEKTEISKEEMSHHRSVDFTEGHRVAVDATSAISRVKKFAQDYFQKMSCLNTKASPQLSVEKTSEKRNLEKTPSLSYLPSKDEVASRIRSLKDETAGDNWKTEPLIQSLFSLARQREAGDSTTLKALLSSIPLTPCKASKLIKEYPRLILLLPDNLRKNQDLIFFAMYLQQERDEERIRDQFYKMKDRPATSPEWSPFTQNGIGEIFRCSEDPVRANIHLVIAVAEEFGWNSITSSVAPEIVAAAASQLDLGKMTENILKKLQNKISGPR